MPMTQEAEDELTGRNKPPSHLRARDEEEARQDAAARFPAEDDSEWAGQELDGALYMGHLSFYFMSGTSEGHPDVEVYGEGHWEAYRVDGGQLGASQWFLKVTFSMEDKRIPYGDRYNARTFPFPETAPLAVSADDVRRLMFDHTWESQERMLRDTFAIATNGNEFYRRLYPVGSRLVLTGTSID